MRSRLALKAAVCVLAATASPARAVTWHVPADAPSVAAALAAAAAGDEIVLACGTYFEHHLELVAGVTLRSEALDADCVTIDGQGEGPVLVGRVLTPGTTVEGLSIVNGDADEGAGVRLEYCELTIRGCRLAGHRSRFSGSAVYALGGSVRLERTVIHDNHVYGGTWACSGAVGMASATARIENCTITDNTFAPALGSNGGGVRGASGADITIFRSIVSRNDPPQYAGHIDVRWTLDCAFTGVDPLFCDFTGADFRLHSDSPCLPGGTCPGLIGALGHGCGPTTSLSYTVNTSPPGLPLVLDGEPTTTPATRVWEQYSEHSVSVEPIVHTAPGTRVRYLHWSDDGDVSHVVIAPRTSGSITAFYGTEHELTLPSTGGGTITPGSGWHVRGSVVTIAAVPAPGWFLWSWIGSGPGSYTGAANPAQVTMLGPVTQSARFEVIPFEFSLSASATDPRANDTTPTGGVRPVYLWLTCARNGLSAVEAEITGTMQVLGFEPLGGVLNAGTATDLLLAVPGCPRGEDLELLLGAFTVFEPPAGGWICLGSAGGGGTSQFAAVGAVDCDVVRPFYSRAPGVTGLSSDGSAPCRKGRQTCEPVPVAGRGPILRTAEDLPTVTEPRAVPNPFPGTVDLHFALSHDGRAAVRVYDVGGRFVRQVLDESRTAGGHRVTWDGRNAEGREVPAGIYFARIRTGDTVRSLKILRVAR